MKIFLLLAVCLLFLTACNNPEKEKEEKVDTWKNRVAEEAQKIEKIKLDINNAELIDSSPWVIYPLVLNKEMIKESGSSSYGSSSSESETYWNILFYNTLTGESRLLDAKRKMIITNKTLPEKAGPPNKKSASFIFYTVIARDNNADGQINSDDPASLFVSDMEGRNFRQISPDSLECEGWDAIPGTDKILINAMRDANKDKKFNNEDEEVFLVYDLKSGAPAKEVFTSDKKVKLKKLFEKEWGK